MQISLKWINELVDIGTISLEELIEKLTLGGFEVEEILEIEIKKEKTIALEISTTANRSDSLSIQGLALEIAALLQKPLKTDNFTNPIFGWDEQIRKLKQKDLKSKDCTEFQTLLIQNLTDFTSPKWLKHKLLASGITPENTILDFQNYVLLETGYPLEVYDLKKIYKKINASEFHLSLTHLMTSPNERFLANDEINYELNNSILIVKANEIPISIAGIVPHKDFECSRSTTSLLVEGSIFNAAKIRQQSRTLGLRTIRSTRYEKSLNTTNLSNKLARFVDLLRINNPNLTYKLHTSSSLQEQKLKTLKLQYENVKEILGPIKGKADQYILPSIVTTALQRLQFQVDYDSEMTSWIVTVPEFRQNDIEREIDLIEEVGRLYGFNNFLTRLPSLAKVGAEDFAYQVRKKITMGLISSGLNELIQYSLVPKSTYLINEVPLVNPLVKDYANLRSSLLPNLIRVVDENNKKSNLTLEGFEYGHVFSISKSKSIHEYESIAGIFGGSEIKSTWSDSCQFLTWFEGKAKLEELFQKLNLVVYWQLCIPVKEKPILHTYRTAELYLSDQSKLGIFGQIHPLLSKKLNLSTKLYLFELNFESIKEQVQKNKLTTYKEYSLYPKIIKDISFVINQDIPFRNLKKVLYLNGSKILTEINLLDEYRGSSIPVGYSSLCIQFVFQSESETLKTKKIEKILDHLQSILINKFEVVIRT